MADVFSDSDSDFEALYAMRQTKKTRKLPTPDNQLPNDQSSFPREDMPVAPPVVAAVPAEVSTTKRRILLDSESDDDITPNPLQWNVSATSSAHIPSANANIVPNFDLSWPSSASEFPLIHHDLNSENLESFVYPIQDSIETRDYQRNIIRKALVRNVLCVLPTGLGKTFIASTVMLNWFLWTKSAKIVFIAPTRPLVMQQAVGFLETTGVSIKHTIALLNDVATKSDREELWKTKRIFFATAQTVENDIDQKIADPHDFVLLVVDEAHHAQKDHSYACLIRKVKTRNPYGLRILGLTATPTATLEQVQLMIDDMDISITEIRSEESIDIQKYTRERNIERIRVDYSEDQRELLSLLASATREQFDLLRVAKIAPGKFDVTDAHHFILRQEVADYMKSPATRMMANNGYKFKVRAVGMQMATLAYNVSLLKEHGIVPFYSRMKKLELELMGSNGVYAKKLLHTPEFKQVVKKCRLLIYGTDKGPTYNYPESDRRLGFYSHPKIQKLCVKIDEFIGCHGADTRIIIFAEFRDSAAEILWMLKMMNAQFVRGSLFVGQATKSDSGVKGMTQKEQRAILEKFKEGEFNVLVATSIGEEGLDIGQVDLIVCYDQSKSPIRNIQRIGRTGRKRAGNVIFFMTQQEERKLEHAFKNYSWICEKINNSASEDHYPNKSSSEVNLFMKLRYKTPNRLLPATVSPKYREVPIEQPPENQIILASDENEASVLVAMKTEVRDSRKKTRPTKRQKKTENQSSLGEMGFTSAAEMYERECAS